MLLVLGCGDDGPMGGVDASADSGLDATVEPDASPDGGSGTECSEPPRDFWLYDLTVMPPIYEQQPFTCRAEGTHGQIWVADSIWEQEMTQGDVDDVLRAFDSVTPADPSMGIYDLTTTAFGEPSDVDGDDRVLLLYYDMQGYGSYEFDGTIRREDVFGGSYSNQAELLYLNGARLDPAGEYMLGVVAHELQHLIHINYDPAEESWLNECLSEAAMVRCGYLGDLDAWVADFASAPNQVTLTDNGPTFHYGAGMLFGTYLMERYGVDLLTALVEEPTHGIASLEAVLSSQGEIDSFESLLGDWALANLLDTPSLEDGRYGYLAFDVPPLSAPAVTVPVADHVVAVAPHGAGYLVLEVTAAEGSSVEITVESAGWQDIEVRWAALPEGAPALAQVGSFAPAAVQDSFTVAGVGGATDRVVVVLVELGGVTDLSAAVSAALP